MMNVHTIQPSTYCCILLRLATVLLVSASVFGFPEPGIGRDIGASLNGKTFHMALNRPETSPYTAWCVLIYTEVFKRLDIPFSAKYHPLQRASEEANDGRVDGEPARIATYGASYPNLIRVEESVFPMTVAAYTANPSAPALEGWESLKGKAFLIEYPRGMKICENNLSAVVRAEQLFAITESIQGLKRLAANRNDLYIDDVNSVGPILNDPTSQVSGKIYVAGIMEVSPLYMYIHKKHQALAPKFAEVIKALKSEGIIEKYRKTAFGISDDPS